MSKDPFTADGTLLAVMSYNRGEYLRNCMDRSRRHLSDFDAIVFDDHSTNRQTQQVLRELSANWHIVDWKAGSTGDRGGLHANMNRAIDTTIERGYRFVCFLQDDMQIVRNADEDFFENVNAVFAADERIAEVCVTFYKGYWPSKVMQSRIGINQEHDYYYHIPFNGWTCGIADCGIVSLERIAAKGFRYEVSEAGSIEKAQSLELHRADCRDPIMMFTPWPGTTSRVFGESISPKKIARSVLIGLQEYGAGAGCHPFLPMNEDAITRLKQRPLEQYPIAELFLTTKERLRQPWWYSACNNISDFKSLKTLLSFEWFTKGPANYRANVRAQQQADGESHAALSRV